MALSDTDYLSTLAIATVANSNTNYTIAANQNLAVDNRGYQLGALYANLNDIVTNWNLAMTKLEADGAATTTYTPDNAFTALASQGHGIEPKGMHQKDLVAQLTEMESKFNAVLALLDADTGVTLTTYTAVATAAGSGSTLDLDNTVVGSLGLSQDAIVSFLDDLADKINAVLGNLDIDAV